MDQEESYLEETILSMGRCIIMNLEANQPREGAARKRLIIDHAHFESVKPAAEEEVSDVLRTVIRYRMRDDGTGDEDVKVTRLIVKMPLQARVRDFSKRLTVMRKEVKCYKDLISRLIGIYGENAFSSDHHNWTKDYVLILDDLIYHGYRTCDSEQLDLEHCKVTLETLARLHGASIRFRDNEPGFVEDNFKDVMVDGKTLREEEQSCLACGFKIAAEEFSKIPELCKYAGRLEECSVRASGVLRELFEMHDTRFHVLNHGNLVASNIFYKYDDDGRPSQARLIDFQAARYNSPAVDLTFFFSGSAKDESRSKRHYVELLETYLDVLNATLERCGVDRRLEMKTLDKMIKDFYFYELYISVTLLPMVLNGHGEVGEENATDLIRENYRTDVYKRIILQRMVDFEEKQVF